MREMTSVLGGDDRGSSDSRDNPAAYWLQAIIVPVTNSAALTPPHKQSKKKEIDKLKLTSPEHSVLHKNGYQLTSPSARIMGTNTSIIDRNKREW